MIQVFTFKVDLAAILFAQTASIVERRRTTDIILKPFTPFYPKFPSKHRMREVRE